MADEKFLKIVRDWAPIVLEPIASKVGLTKAVDAFAMAVGRQADALALFQKRPDRRVRPGAEAILLRPDRSPVPFAGREKEVAEFEDWMFSDGWMKWRLLTGPSGRGKTRLMMGVIDRLNGFTDRPVRAGFLDLEKLERNPAALGGFAGHSGVKDDLLLVVDYAERARQPVVAVLKLALMLERLAEAGTARRVRVVLIARGWSEVWEDIGREHKDIQEVLIAEGLELVDLPPLAETIPDRLAEFDRAYAAFDRYFRKVERGDPPPPDRRPDLSPGLGRDDYADAVMIHLAALALHQGAMNATDMSAERLLNWIVDRERGEWARRIAAAGLGTDITPKAMEQAVGIATLVALSDSAPDEVALVRLLGTCSLLADQSVTRRSRIADILHDLYPGSGHTAGLAPDLIGTWFLGQLEPKYYRTVFEFLGGYSIVNGLIKLNWLAQSWRPDGEPWNQDGADRIWAAIDSAPARVLSAAVAVARLSNEPIGQIAAEWFKVNGSGELARAVINRTGLPHPTTALREFAAQIESALLCSAGAEDGTHNAVARKARHTGNLSIRLSDLGQHEEAHAAGEEAAVLFRSLTYARPDAFRPDLAQSLNNLSLRLSNLGRREEALAAIEEAVAIRRALAEKRPDAFRPDLATSLGNLSNRLSSLGRREEALAASEEAAGLHRALADVRPDAFRPDLATSLNNLSLRLSDLGRREEALAAIEEAVAIRRALADVRPDAFRPDLAHSLSNLASCLSALGRREEALIAIEESVVVRRALADARPDAFRSDLAMSLNNLGIHLSDLGRREEALAAIEEAVAIRRALADTRPDAFMQDLATSLGAYGSVLQASERHAEAADRFGEGLRLLAPYLQRLPQAFAPLCAALLRDHLQSLLAAGREPDWEALAPIVEILAEQGVLDLGLPDEAAAPPEAP
ncbi:tetratricopeptide repeat protein [Thalassobaculum sp.]|uniref:tetratricopeptide repeat protein n=1 Tax=Thalassobaculum sp. TaxID=2022740 RepID=UPI0032ED7171